jgi:putative selenate reductase molybdopterin-binding subunit
MPIPSEFPRVDVAAKVRADAPLYAGDRVPHPHLVAGLITAEGPHTQVTIDGDAARAVPGIVGVFDARDDPGVRWCPNPHGGIADAEVFAAEAHHPGTVVGAVVARDAATLERALAVVGVTESPVVPPPAAAEEGALGSSAIDVEAEFAAAPHVLDGTWVVAGGQNGAIERACAGARWAGGTCHVWSTTQTPRLIRAPLAGLLGVDADAVVVEPVMIGGGFGSKEELFLEPLAAVLSRACGGRPVFVEPTRQQLARLRRRHPARVRSRIAFDDAGHLLARAVDVELDAGASFEPSPSVAANAAYLAAVAYPAPVWRATWRALRTSATPSHAFRGYGAVEAHFAVESQIDEAAAALRLDPFELRARWSLRAGDRNPVHGWTVRELAVDECLAVGRTAYRQTRSEAGRYRRGIGIASLVDTSGATRPSALDVAHAAVVREPKGGIVVETAAVELGQGVHSALAAVAADELGVDPSAVRVELGDVDDKGSFGSRGAALTANAVRVAARDLVHDPKAVRAVGRYVARDDALVYGVQIVVVVVDTATGGLTIESVTSVHDAGVVLHRAAATGQVTGGIVQGIGIATTEHDSTTLLGAGVPTAAAAPDMEVLFVEGCAGEHGRSSKGLGEAPILGIAPALVNAIHDATGVRPRELPVTSARLFELLQARPL